MATIGEEKKRSHGVAMRAAAGMLSVFLSVLLSVLLGSMVCL